MHRFAAALVAIIALAAVGMAQPIQKYYLQLSPSPGAITTPNSTIQTDSNGAVSAAPSGFATRTTLGAGAGNGVNLLDTKYGADPTGVSNNDAALHSAVNDACNNASPLSQTKEVYIPAGIYAFSPVALISVTNACWIHGQGPLIGGTQGGTVLRIGVGIASDFFQYRAVGQLKVTDLRIDMSGGQQIGAASYCRVHSGGTGYGVSDTIVLAGGTRTLGTTLVVTAQTGGAVTGCVIAVPGGYSQAPSPVAAVTQGSTSGAGSGATFDMIYASAAAISISGPATTLTANAANGATVLTVASCTGFLTGGAVEVEQDDGNYKVTTQVGACTANTLTLSAGLTFAAASTHRVYAKYTSNPLIDNVVIVGFWDGIRIDNAGFVTVRDTYIQDYSHDGIIKINGASPITGADRYQVTALDLNLGTSSAGVEVIAGGDVAIGERSKFLGSNFSVLLNTFFTLTGTLLIEDNSLEEVLSCAVRLHQSVVAKEYHNVVVVGNEFSSLATQGQHFCVDSGTANTSPKWINLINFSHNSSNSAVTSGINMVQVLDGDNIVIAGNTLYNNGTAGPNGIAVGGAATRVLEFGNEISGYPTGNYGTMQASSLDAFKISGVALPALPTTGVVGGLVRQNAAGGALTISASTSSQSTPANPTGTASATTVMMGLSGAITPTNSGNILITISGNVNNSILNSSAVWQIYTGTGTAPTNGVGVTGSARGAANSMLAAVAGDAEAFSAQALVTGLAVGTAVWIDLGLSAGVSGTATVKNIVITAIEL